MGKDDRIVEYAESEYTSISDGAHIADKVAYSANKNEMLSIECESGKSIKKATIKQGKYCLSIYKKNYLDVKPIMITTNYNKRDSCTINWYTKDKDCSCKSYIYSTKLINGDKMLSQLKNKVNNNIPINKIDIIFLVWAPYSEYSITPFELLLEISKILNIINIKENILNDLKVMHIQDCKRLIKDKKQQEKIFEVIEMECTMFEQGMENLKNTIINEKNEEIELIKREKDILIEEKDNTIVVQSKELEEKDEEIKKLLKEIQELKKNN